LPRGLKLIVPALVLAWAFTTNHPAYALGQGVQPTRAARQPDEPEICGPHRVMVLGAIKVYQTLMGPARGVSCPMHPSCSAYALEAFRLRNPAVALLMTTDRLQRCGHDLRFYEPILVDGALRALDLPGAGGQALRPDEAAGHQARRGMACLDDTSEFAERWSPAISAGNDSLLFCFARSLQTAGDFYGAITEFRRLLFFHPHSRYSKQARLHIVECLYGSEEYHQAIAYGLGLLPDSRHLYDEAQIRFLIAASHFRLGDFPEAWQHLSVVAAPDSGTVTEKCLLLEGLAYANGHHWDVAQEIFQTVREESRFYPAARTCAELCLAGKHMKMKSPAVAGVLAVIPGLGYLYAGHTQTAASAFVINGLFAWGSLEAFDRGYPGLGATLAFFGASWYGGNIYGSVASARRRNARMQDDLLLQFDVGFRF
jgi:tetratricopeptide (TPR) repeat protein